MLRALEGSPESGWALSVVWIAVLLWTSLVITWSAGGTDHLPPHWYYLPVLIAGVRFGPLGAVVAGFVSGLCAGPLTPADVKLGTAQPLSDWGVRGLFFMGIGTVFTLVTTRSRATVAEELDELRRTTELAGAIEREDFVLEYQPVVALADRGILGVEALVRWNHPDQGRISPDQFIPQAESSGQILPLGDWIIEDACSQLARWLQGPVTPDTRFRMAVNVSGVQLERGDLALTVERALRRWRIPPDRLVLELTETTVLTEKPGSRRQLQRLRDLGVHVAVDDFGTGYSSLAYLRELPVDIVKIDRAFVERLGESAHEDDRRIASGIIDLAHDLGMSVVAEGIETEVQADTLIDLGCQAGQGFLFSASLPPDEITALLTQHASNEPAFARVGPPTKRPAKGTATIVRRALRSPDTTGQHRARTTALAAMFLAGACMSMTTTALAPDRTGETLLAAAFGFTGFPTAFLLLRHGHRLPPWSIHLLLATGAVIVSMGAVLSQDPGVTVATTALYVWVVLYAAAFYDWRTATAHFGVVACCLTVVLTVTHATQPVGVMVFIMGTAAVAAGVIGWLARQLQTMASTDLLTGLPNRQAFEGLLPREVARANRDGTPLCLAVVDIDGFKEINDSHGHQVGDEILAELPVHWQRALRDGDLLARVGGDEFVVLLPDCRLEDAAAVLARMSEAGSPGCSVGVACLGEGEPGEGLLYRADQALYRAKRSGLGQVVADGPDLPNLIPVVAAAE